MPLQRPNQSQNNKQQLEEQYEKTFGKIARDFVHIEDMQEILDKIFQFMLTISISNVGVSVPALKLNNSRARSKGIVYKDVIETGKNGSKLFVDLIKIDEDDNA